MQNLITILIGIALGITSCYFAKRRGRNPYAWFFIGLFLGIFGLLLLLILPDKKQMLVPTAENPNPLAPNPAELPEKPLNHGRFWYYVDKDNRQFGPMNFDALQDALKEEKITQLSLVWNETMDKWLPLKECNFNTTQGENPG